MSTSQPLFGTVLSQVQVMEFEGQNEYSSTKLCFVSKHSLPMAFEQWHRKNCRWLLCGCQQLKKEENIHKNVCTTPLSIYILCVFKAKQAGCFNSEEEHRISLDVSILQYTERV